MTTLTIIGLIIIAFFIFLFAYAYAINYHVRRKAQEDEYDRSFKIIQDVIYSSDIAACNYDHIQRMFCALNKLPHKDKRRTHELYTAEFLVRFSAEVYRRRDAEMEIKSGNEFSPEETLRKN